MDDDDLAFLPLNSDSNATGTVIVLLPDNSVTHIYNVNPLVVLDQCPLLYHAFEFSAHCFPQANIEATSRSAVVSLLRYLYTGDYLADHRLDNLLDHAQVYKLAADFDVPALQVFAYANFTAATERACSFATPPADLVDTIRFLYNHLATLESRQEQTLIDTLLHYLLATFAYHDLGNNEDFLKVMYDIPEFHKDLCRLNMQRDFQDDGALSIVQIPGQIQTFDYNVDVAIQNLHDFWQDHEDPAIVAVDGMDQNDTNYQINDATDAFGTLTHRPRHPFDMTGLPEFTANEQEDHGFTLVHRPRSGDSGPLWEDESPVTSPEVVPDQFDRDSDGDTLVEGEWSLI